ncbi:hypothetical protein KFL_000080550 [Klebsormidium nitens]|uniref:Uncharacterized protein n=1 Tax=Klebsormidium nitens TaxID=105231 RepID=A0A1Y1HLW2_KLENI|nr:hypothetical protein KFL_000080550 [Klebsormidium nitens]|eukprot:GAQ78149.1 hypothetical protein KFL_000080550 [Klebsormidium nitens]
MREELVEASSSSLRNHRISKSTTVVGRTACLLEEPGRCPERSPKRSNARQNMIPRNQALKRPNGTVIDTGRAKRLRLMGFHGISEYEEAVAPRESAGDQTKAEVFASEAFYERGVIAVKEERRADGFECFRGGAALGSARCMLELAACFAEGDSCPQDVIAAVALFNQAHNLPGFAEVLGAELARVQYKLGKSAFDAGSIKAVEFLTAAADYGHPGAQYELGTLHELGWGVERNMDEAIVWWGKAADQNDLLALYKLGECHRDGKRVARDSAKAAALFSRAAELGHVSAGFEVGWCYFTGWGVARDFAEAFRWFRKAAEQGDRTAQSLVAYCYRSGTGVTKNVEKGLAWSKGRGKGGSVREQRTMTEC